MPDEPRLLTPFPFTSAEAASIREAIATPGVDVLECPRSEELLSVQRSPEGELLTLTCEPCRRILVLRREGYG
jgi:hypothetical protein